MGDLSDFQRGQIVGEHLTGASVTYMATLLGVYRTAVSNVMTSYTNHGRHHQLRGTVAENQY